jgi:hypothetical protein
VRYSRGIHTQVFDERDLENVRIKDDIFIMGG